MKFWYYVFISLLFLSDGTVIFTADHVTISKDNTIKTDFRVKHSISLEKALILVNKYHFFGQPKTYGDGTVIVSIGKTGFTTDYFDD